MTITHTEFLTKEAYILENDLFQATVLPTEGSNLISLVDKSNNIELLRTPKTLDEYLSRRMVFGTPVLFPPNRIEDATFVYKGKRYNLEMNRAKENNHIHGFVHDKEWKVIKIDEENNLLVTELSSVDHPSILKQFPHAFTLTMTIKLTLNGIEQTLKVTNLSEEEMPVGFGYHTVFYFNNKESVLDMEIGDQWEFGERSLPTGRFITSPLKDSLKTGTKLTGVALDDEYFMTDNKTAVIHHPDADIDVIYTVNDAFKHWVLFTADGMSDFLAIEPYSWITNAPNLSLSSDLTGLRGLNPKEELVFTTFISTKKRS